MTKFLSALFLLAIVTSCNNSGKFQVMFSDATNKTDKIFVFDTITIQENVAIPNIQAATDGKGDDASFFAYREVLHPAQGNSMHFTIVKVIRSKYEGRPTVDTLSIHLFVPQVALSGSETNRIGHNENSLYLCESGGPPCVWQAKNGTASFKKNGDSLSVSVAAIFQDEKIGSCGLFIWETGRVESMKMNASFALK